MAQPVEVLASGVVVGSDGSGNSRPALEWAAAAASAHGLPLTLALARPDSTGARHEVTDASGVLDRALTMVRERHPGLEVRALQFPESPVVALLAASETADFVVLGSRGLEGFRGLLVGSTTMHVAPYSRCPVVVVHAREPDAAAGARHAGQVILGYDGSPASHRASAFAFRHAAAIGAGVVVVSVEPGKGGSSVRDVHPDQELPGSDSSAFHAPVVVTAASFPRVPVTYVAGTGRPAEVLIAEADGSELLVVGSRGKGGSAGLVMGSVSQKVLAHARCPVAILHEGVAAFVAAGASS